MDECVLDLLLNFPCEALTDCRRTFLVFLQRRRRLHVIWTRRFPFLANEYTWRSTQSFMSESVESGSRDRAPTLRESARRLQRDTSAAGKRRRTGQLGPGKKTPLLLLTTITRFLHPTSRSSHTPIFKQSSSRTCPPALIFASMSAPQPQTHAPPPPHHPQPAAPNAPRLPFVRRHPFFAFGAPFLALIVGSSFLLQGITSTRCVWYTRRGERVQQADGFEG